MPIMEILKTQMMGKPFYIEADFLLLPAAKLIQPPQPRTKNAYAKVFSMVHLSHILESASPA